MGFDCSQETSLAVGRNERVVITHYKDASPTDAAEIFGRVRSEKCIRVALFRTDVAAYATAAMR